MAPLKIKFIFGKLEVTGTLNESDTANVIYGTLPFDSSVSCWGDEIYFEIPVKLPAEVPTLDVKVGDIAYWPQGACLCLFFGKTPISVDNKPRPASEVTVIGTFSASARELRKITDGAKVRMAR
jgi:hypothetical protein